MARKQQNRPQKGLGEAIVGDGLCEKIYFDQLKMFEDLRLNIHPQLPKAGSWKTVFDKVEDLLNREYSHVYCSIDFDKVIEEKAFDQYEKRKTKLLKTNKVSVFECNPCFETWFLVHFSATKKPFSNCETVVTDLSKHIENYSKSEAYFVKKNIYKTLKPHQEVGFKNAENLEKNREEFSNQHPRAEIFKLVKQLVTPPQ